MSLQTPIWELTKCGNGGYAGSLFQQDQQLFELTMERHGKLHFSGNLHDHVSVIQGFLGAQFRAMPKLDLQGNSWNSQLDLAQQQILHGIHVQAQNHQIQHRKHRRGLRPRPTRTRSAALNALSVLNLLNLRLDMDSVQNLADFGSAGQILPRILWNSL